MTDTRSKQAGAALAGRTIAVPESRALDLFCRMLEDRGAAVWRCPLVEILDAPEPQPVLDWAAQVCAGELDDLILLTGEGLRRILGLLARTNEVQRALFVGELAKLRTICRGPKPARELRELGLKPGLMAAQPTTAGVIQTLSEQDLHGRVVGVQLYGTDPNQTLQDFLNQAGAQPRPVAPYIYADQASEAEVAALIAAIAEQRVDAIAFTSAAQLRYLFRVARARQQQDALLAGLQRICLASIGPVVTEVLQGHGLQPTVQPDSQYFMKPLTNALVEHFRHRDEAQPQR